MATGTMEDYGAPVQTTSLSLSSMELLCFEMFPDAPHLSPPVSHPAKFINLSIVDMVSCDDASGQFKQSIYSSLFKYYFY